MFVKREEYENNLRMLHIYKEECNDKTIKIGDLEIENNNLKDLNEKLEERVKEVERRSEVLANNNAALIMENSKLIEWIETIINKTGCYHVNDKSDVTIPIYRRIDGFAYNNIVDGEFVPQSIREEFVVPQIRFLKMK